MRARIRSRGAGLRSWSVHSFIRSFVHSFIRSVLIEHARAGALSMAMIGMRVMMLSRELSPPLNRVARRLRISAQIIFFPAQGGGAVRKGGAGLWVEVCLCYSGEKTVY